MLSIAAGLVVAAGLGIGLAVGVASGPQRAPAFSLPRLGGGKEVRRPVVLTFFASWCTPCVSELPAIARVARQQQAAGHGVVFVGVDANDDPSSGLSFARHSGVSFAVGSDAASALAPKFELVGYPGTVFIDASGNVIGTVHGPVSRSTLLDYVARLSHA
jgi:thiol-disulfide isomerase/thioredoxin